MWRHSSSSVSIEIVPDGPPGTGAATPAAFPPVLQIDGGGDSSSSEGLSAIQSKPSLKARFSSGRAASLSPPQVPVSFRGTMSRQSSACVRPKLSAAESTSSRRLGEAHTPARAARSGTFQSGSNMAGEEVARDVPGDQDTHPIIRTALSTEAFAKRRQDAAPHRGRSTVSWGPVEEAPERSTNWKWRALSSSSGSDTPPDAKHDKQLTSVEIDEAGRKSFVGSPYSTKRDTPASARVDLARLDYSDVRELLPHNVHWVPRGSRLWALLCLVFVFRVICAVALLIAGAIAFSKIRQSTACKATFCFKDETVFSVGVGYGWAQNMLNALEWQLLIPVLVLAGTILVNSCLTFAVVWERTKETAIREERATVICGLISTFCLAGLVGPFFLVRKGFCEFGAFDWMYLLGDTAIAATRAGDEVCNQNGMVLFTIIIAVIAVCSEMSLFFRGYARLFEATLVLGYLKFAGGAALLFMAILISRDSMQYQNATRDIRNALLLKAVEERWGGVSAQSLLLASEPGVGVLNEAELPTVDALPTTIASQYSLFFDTSMAALYIMGFVDIGCGLYGCLAAYRRSPMLAGLNVLVNFVFVVVNAVAVGGMFFGSKSLQFTCNYKKYPVRQLPYDHYFSRLVCQSRAVYLTSWAVLVVLTLLFLVDFLVSAWGFIQAYCRKGPAEAAALQKNPEGKTD
ncbi:hypothetical protein BESB_067110 [Besnoitia besnoiti]|uniref:Transmembrane protein n=1 Tax=Besnoitia besnoiti TaxID=94643 RepID=A0A2A9M871_BESBE|nr:hypothetical protein BESB_067110 [Besnoitia besnoiti]PFH34678.1 hypothetical protein BESB_067110 [Besnoitia besnoiti]